MDAKSIARLRLFNPYGDPISNLTIGEICGPFHVDDRRQYQHKYGEAFKRIEGGILFMPASLADLPAHPHHSSGRPPASVRFLSWGVALDMVDKDYLESLNVDGETPVHDAISGQDICTACEDVDFGGSSGWQNKRPRCLGKAADLLSCRHCSFCRLATQFLQNQQGESIQELVQISDGFDVFMTSVPAVYPLSSGPPGSRLYEILLHFVHQQKTMKTALAARIREQADSATALFKGRLVRPLLDVQLTRRWLDDCVRYHAECSGCVPSDPGNDAAHEPGLLVIDVEQACLVNKPAGARYIALSYVWPRPKEGLPLRGDPLKLVKANRESLMRPGSLLRDAPETRLPNVMREAMQVVRALGESYLWIDALCIVQDDPDTKAGLIGKMDLVYGNAYLTVVVATLQSPEQDYHIPGVGSVRHAQAAGTVDGHGMLAAIPGYNIVLSHTYWATRGWTFQEGILSRRCLYLTDRQAYFRCVRDVRCEDVVTETAEGDSAAVRRHPPMAEKIDVNFECLLSPRFVESISKTDSFSEYCGIARSYSRRQLTVPSDVLIAFAGVLKKLLPQFGVRDGFVAGLPVSSFDRALMWYSIAPVTRRYPWPTWSWAGWVGPIDYESQVLPQGQGMLDMPHCMWYRLANDGRGLVPVRNYRPDLVQPSFSLGLLWAKLPIIEAGFGSRLATWARLIRRRLAPADQERHVAGWVSDPAQSVPFLSILDSQGDACGFIASADRSWLGAYQAAGGGLCDLLLLSLAVSTSADSLCGRDGIYHEKYSISCNVKTSFTNVLLIKHGDGDQPATRHGAGKIHNAAFEADDIADVDTRLVVLA